MTGKIKKFSLIALLAMLIISLSFAIAPVTMTKTHADTTEATDVVEVVESIEVTDADGNVTYLANFKGFNTPNVTLKLLADVGDYNLNLNNVTGVVLDLNGYTFSKQINLNIGAGLTIKDSSEEETGKVIVNTETNDTYAAIVIMRGTLTIESGTIETTGTTGAIQASCATVTITGGKIISQGDGVQLGTWAVTSDKYPNNVVMEGGEIEAVGCGIVDSNKCAGTTVSVIGGKIISQGDSLSVTTGTATVTGGTFSSDVSDYWADGYVGAVDADGNYVVGVLPTADVQSLGYTYVEVTEYIIYDLIGGTGWKTCNEPFAMQIAMQFNAIDSAEEAANNAFANYTTDFYITLDGFDGSIVANGCYIAGYYPSFDAWVKIPLDGFTIKAGEAYPVISSLDYDFSYVDICSSVKEFTCGIYLSDEILAANPGLTVSLDLGLSEDLTAAKAADSFVTVDEHKYVAEEDIIVPVAKVGSTGYATLAAAINAAVDGDTIALLADVELAETLSVAGKTITLDLNGKTIAGTDNNTSGNFYLINNTGKLTVQDSASGGKITLTAMHDTKYNRSSVVIANNPGGELNVASGTIEHLGGHTMAYAIDNITNGKGSSAITTVNGGTVKSTYVAIRQFLNGVEATNKLTINAGEINGENCSLFVQSPSTKANTGNLEVSAEAKLTNRVYISATEGATEWLPVISIAKAALKDEVEVVLSEMPEGYELRTTDGIIGIVKVVAQIGDVRYETLQAAIDAAQNGNTITVLENIELTEGVTVEGKTITLDLNGKTVSMSVDATAASALITNKGVLTIKDSGENGKLSYAVLSGTSTEYSTSTIINNGTLTVVSGIIEHKVNATGNAAYAIDNYNTLTVEGGTITTNNKIAIRQAQYGSCDNTITITGGKIVGTYSALQTNVSSSAKKTTVDITGGELVGDYGYYAFYTYYSVVDSSKVDIKISGGVFNGYVFLNNDIVGSDKYDLDVSITGGTFVGGAYIYTTGTDTDAEGYNVQVPVKAISGGEFVEVYESWISDYITDGFKLVENGDENEDGSSTFGIVNATYFAFANLALNGTIDFNFYAQFASNEEYEELKAANAYVEFVIDGVVRETILLAAANTEYLQSNGVYGFGVSMYATELSKLVTATMYVNGENGERIAVCTRVSSIKEIADHTITLYKDIDQELVGLMEALLNYGAYSQVHFGVEIENLANENVTNKDVSNGADVSEVVDMTYSDVEGDDISAKGATLILESETNIRAYFEFSNGKTADDYKFKVDGAEVGVAYDPTYGCYVEVAKVISTQLDTQFTVTVEDAEGNSVISITYSALNYVQKTLEHSNDSTLLDLVKALNLYSQAAEKYFSKLAN